MFDAEYSFLTDGDFTLPYKSYGSGDELLLCFHGFGRISDDFHRFEKALGQRYTLIAFDFLFHGPHSVSVKKRLPAFTPAVLSNMVEKLLWEKKKVRCSLMGYSQGGKTVMGLVHKIPHRIHELFVLAPDGMKNNAKVILLQIHAKNPKQFVCHPCETCCHKMNHQIEQSL